MGDTMTAVRLYADLDPRPDFKLGFKDVEGKQTYLGSKVWRNPELRIEDTTIPEPGPGQVLLEVKACGICGSDVHGMDGSTGRRQPPVIMGHEASGVIARTGSAVEDWRVGNRVTFDSTVYCGACHFCRSGQLAVVSSRPSTQGLY